MRNFAVLTFAGLFFFRKKKGQIFFFLDFFFLIVYVSLVPKLDDLGWFRIFQFFAKIFSKIFTKFFSNGSERWVWV